MPPDSIPLHQLRRVLVVKLRHHGDVLLTSPLLATLKQHAPQAEIDALVYADTAPMLAEHPDLSQLFAVPRKNKGLAAEWLAGRLQVDGRAEVTARHVSSRLSTLRPIGSYQLKLSGGEAVALDLSTLEGSLRLSGSGQWVGGRLRFNGEASAAPGLEAQLANLLNIIGRRQGDRPIISFG